MCHFVAAANLQEGNSQKIDAMKCPQAAVTEVAETCKGKAETSISLAAANLQKNIGKTIAFPHKAVTVPADSEASEACKETPKTSTALSAANLQDSSSKTLKCPQEAMTAPAEACKETTRTSTALAAAKFQDSISKGLKGPQEAVTHLAEARKELTKTSTALAQTQQETEKLRQMLVTLRQAYALYLCETPSTSMAPSEGRKGHICESAWTCCILMKAEI